MNTDFTHTFGNPETLLQSLNEFKNISWEGQTVYDVIKEYHRRFRTMPTYPITLRKGTIVFRARKNGYAQKELFETVNDIGIIPSKYVTSLGRANLPNQPVFYCSTNEETVVKEVTQWYINDNGRAQDLITKKVMGMDWNPFTCMMTISAWTVKEDLNIGLLFGDEQKRSLAIQDCAKRRFELINGETPNYNKSKNLLLDFFSAEFGKSAVRHQFDYLYSALYASSVLNNHDYVENSSTQFDGIKYPSIANDFRGENYAISEIAFKNKLEFIGANYCYTCNNKKPIIDCDSSVLIGRDKCAFLQNDGSFLWGDCEDTFDYVTRIQNQFHLVTLAGVPNRFSKAVKSIGS
jgi:hypothetical protein